MSGNNIELTEEKKVECPLHSGLMDSIVQTNNLIGRLINDFAESQTITITNGTDTDYPVKDFMVLMSNDIKEIKKNTRFVRDGSRLIDYVSGFYGRHKKFCWAMMFVLMLLIWDKQTVFNIIHNFIK